MSHSVQLSRRHVLAAAGSLSFVAIAGSTVEPGAIGRALSATNPQGAFTGTSATGKASAIMRGAAAVSGPSAAQGAGRDAVAVARTTLERLGSQIKNRDVVAVADFSRPSSDPRLHLIDMVGGHIERLEVAHGKGSDPARTGWLKRFSNAPGSDCTSQGAYVTGPYYVGEHGRSMRVEGLDPTNSNAEARAIVIHPAWYANPGIVRVTGMLGRSDGCFAVSQANSQKLLDRLGPGRLLIATRLT